VDKAAPLIVGFNFVKKSAAYTWTFTVYFFFDTSISMALVQKREKGCRSVLACAKSDQNRQPQAVLGSRVRPYWKNLEIFMACIFFSSF